MCVSYITHILFFNKIFFFRKNVSMNIDFGYEPDINYILPFLVVIFSFCGKTKQIKMPCRSLMIMYPLTRSISLKNIDNKKNKKNKTLMTNFRYETQEPKSKFP